MGKFFPQLQLPIDLPDSVVPAKSLKELSVLSGISCVDALKTNSFVNESIAK